MAELVATLTTPLGGLTFFVNALGIRVKGEKVGMGDNLLHPAFVGTGIGDPFPEQI
jgi:hypothetical protein